MTLSAPGGHARWLPRTSVALQLMAAIVLLLILGVVGQQLLQLRNTVVTGAERQMARLDMVFAEQTGRAVESVALVMASAIDAVHVAGRHGNVVPEAIDAMLQHRIVGVRQIVALGITDAQGRFLYSSRGAGAPRELPATGLVLLRHFAAHAGTDTQISEPIRDAAGHWTALMGRRISGTDGSFAGIAVADLNLQYFEDFYQAVELGENGAIILQRRDGTVLARFPHDDAVIGTSFAKLPPFRDVLSHAVAGTLLMTSPIDGSERVLAIRALKAFPLAVQVSVEESRVLAPWRRETLIFLIAVLAACAVIGVLLLLLARESRRGERLLGEFKAARDAAEIANAQLLAEMADRERAESAMRQAQRIEAVGQLTGGVAHDFNNLLTVLLGNIDLLQHTVALDAAAIARLSRMRVAAERGATLTDQLLAFARRQPLAPRAVDIDAVVRNMADLLQSAVGSNIVIETKFADDPWPAMVDPTQLELVIFNLAINARDAMPKGGMLTIATSTVRLGPPERPEDPLEGDYAMFRVSDTGSGMTPAVQAKAFEPFFTTKGPGLGSGLGLSQAFGVARQSGGDVRIESGVGLGTSVRVFLPRASETPVALREAAVAVLGTGGGSIILLVDDDEAVRSTTGMILETMGYTVQEAESGQGALALLAAAPAIDILLTDVAMPGMNGPELARQVRQMRPLMPIVFFSGYADPESVAGGAIPQRMVRKPFRAAELAAQIEAALAEFRQTMAATVPGC